MLTRGLVADAAVLRVPGTELLPAAGIILPFPVQARTRRALKNFCHAGKTKPCPTSMSWRCCQFIGHSCSNPIHIDHQYRTESTHAGVKQ